MPIHSLRSCFPFLFVSCLALNHVSVCASAGRQIPMPFVDSYELLDYEPLLRVADEALQFTVTTCNLTLHVELNRRVVRRDADQFRTIVDVDGESMGVESYFYTGRVRDDNNSEVYGTVMDGQFVGHIRLFQNGHFTHLTIERIPSMLLTEGGHSRFHSIIYSDNDIEIPSAGHKRSKRQISEALEQAREPLLPVKRCALTNELYGEILRKQQPAQDDKEEGGDENFQFVRSGRMWREEGVDSDDTPVRHKSASTDTQFLPSSKHSRLTHPTARPLHPERTCSLYLQTDHTLYHEVFISSEGMNDHKRTREVINGLLEAFVASLNQIFEAIDFNGVRGVNFAIRRISIYTNQSCSGRYRTSQKGSGGGSWNPFCEENVRDASRMLELNAMQDHSAYCLAYVFTARSFDGGTLGLAWVAGESPLTAGGICHHSRGAGLGSIFQQQSMNTGVVSMVSEGKKVPLRTSQLTLAHEVGHSFGAPHDGPECDQLADTNSRDGEYLMAPTNTPGDMPNNDKFSPCSVKAISAVLHEVLKHPSLPSSSIFRPLVAPKRNCFEARTTPFCGNQMVEEGEQCDCGYAQSDCNEKGDRCCEPRLSRFGSCTRRWRSACSPSEGPCCNATSCDFKIGGRRVPCREATECALEQFCDGRSARCPTSLHLPDGTPCEDATKTCNAGACNGSICESVGLQDCTLARGGIYRLCHLACVKHGVCRSSFELAEFAGGNFAQRGRDGQPGILFQPGTHCGNQGGHCDEQYRCRTGDGSPNALVVIKEFLVDVLEGVYRWIKAMRLAPGSVGSVAHRVVCLICLALPLADSLNHFIDSYDTLSYRPLVGRRSKRSVNEISQPVDLRFRSLSRTFHLRLWPVGHTAATRTHGRSTTAGDGNVFAEDHVIDVDGAYQIVDGDDAEFRPREFLYEGVVKGEPGSVVYGSILDGLFDGHILLPDGRSYTVEKVSRYLNASAADSPRYHSLIYADDLISYNRVGRAKRTKRSSGVEDLNGSDHHHGCGLTKEIHRRMRHLQESAADIPVGWSKKREGGLEEMEAEWGSPVGREFAFPYRYMNRTKRELLLTTNGASETGTNHGGKSRGNFGPRDVNGKRLHGVRTCTVYLQADHKLYESIYAKEGQRNHIRTREEIVSLFYNHIKAVNQIYEATDFGGVNGLNFVIQRTSIYTKDSCANGKPVEGSENPFCEENVDVSNYLNLNSQRNHSAFCLAYALTFRDFVGGTLGLAWVASPTFSTAGGICQVYQKYNEGQAGTAYRSLNTGIITLVNYGNRVPLRVSQLTMAHEIGHNFGSPHDQTAECQPGLPDGNYIMFASATSGDKVNNAKFSPCSVNSISAVLYEVLQQTPIDIHRSSFPLFGKKRNCFQERTSAFCGNQIREPGEECDCGFSQRDCDEMGDRCCLPRESHQGSCRRATHARCSPSEGLCCKASSCDFYTATSRQLCREESECQFSQYCDGRGAACPESEKKTDGLPCQDVTKVCRNGTCDGSICAQVGLKDCFLTEGKPAQLCHLACEKNGTCYSSFDLPEFGPGKYQQQGRENQAGLLLHPGSPCNNYKGYCDILRKCRSVDSNGPLARLKNLLFNRHTIKTVSQWVQEHWWACVLIGIGVLLFMALFVKCCAVHTPSTNPNKMPAQLFSETLRHPGTLLRRGRPPRQDTYTAHPVAHSGQLNSVVVASGSNGGAGRHERRPRRDHKKTSAAGRATDRANRANNSRRAGDAVAGPSIRAAGPPLIAQPAAPSPAPVPETSTQPVPVTCHEPPPPYTPTDPAAAAASAAGPSNSARSPESASTAPNMPATPVGTPLPKPSSSPAPIAISAPPLPTPVSLPAVPLPPPPIPGPPLPGQGPKPGRRKPKGHHPPGGSKDSSRSSSHHPDAKKGVKKRSAK